MSADSSQEGASLPNFDDVESVHRWADSWVQSNLPSALDTITGHERDHLQRFETELGRGLHQFYAEYGALIDLTDDLNYIDRSHWPQHRVVQYVLLSKNLAAMHSAMDRLSKGFYQDSLTLIRGAYDAWLRLVHISCFPNDPHSALVHRPPKGTVVFNATDLVQVQLRLDWLGKYRIMSAFAHANTFEALQSLRRAHDEDGEPERFGLQLAYDENMVGVCFPFLEFLALAYLRFILERLLPPDEAPTSGVMGRSIQAAKFLTGKFRAHPKPYWSTTMNDLDYVFALLEVADDGGDWRAMREQRPVVSRGFAS